MNNKVSVNIAMFVGAKFYPRWGDYYLESLRLGCCKKLPRIPDDITVGVSQCFLLHREEQGEPAKLFAWFTIDGIVKCSLQQQLADEVRKVNGSTIGIPALRAEHRRQLPLRGCGQIDPPSYYIVSPHDITAQLGFRKSPSGADGLRIHLMPLDGGIPTNIEFFRGFKYIGDIKELIQ